MARTNISLVFLLLFCSFVQISSAKRFVLVLDDEDGTDENQDRPALDELSVVEKGDEIPAPSEGQDVPDSEGFIDPDDSEHPYLYSSSSWQDILEGAGTEEKFGETYTDAVKRMFGAISEGDPDNLADAIKDIKGAADLGHPHAQSTFGFLHGSGYGMEQNELKSFLYHSFAANGGDYQSKMALAYSYFRQQMYDKSVDLYAELATTAVASFMTSKDSPLMEAVRLNIGAEENKDALKKFRGEEDDDFQFLEYQAQKGHSKAMYKIGILYYFGLRGLRRDHAKALSWFLKATEKGDVVSLEFLGEIYAWGYGVERNYTKAYEYFRKALREKIFSAYNGLGYLYLKGLGVDKQNFTMAKEFFKKAKEHEDPNGIYNLGVLSLKGIGVKKNIKLASRHFLIAANAGHTKAYYQLAQMAQKGVGLKKNLAVAAQLYKIVAERGPWGSLLRWGLEYYLKGDYASSLLLYSSAAELGYEVAQSNAAWILDKYRDEATCIGQSGFCADTERYQRAHKFWRHASEQGNEFAALLIGDAYYYGQGIGKDLERAAEAYARARLQQNAQAMFNLGYMYEHGLGLPVDYHLAKRYYDEAVETDPAAGVPVSLALMGLWLRQHYQNSSLVKAIDMLPEWTSKSRSWLQNVSMGEGNATLFTLIVCLLTVLYFRQRQRRIAVQAIQQNRVE